MLLFLVNRIGYEKMIALCSTESTCSARRKKFDGLYIAKCVIRARQETRMLKIFGKKILAEGVK